MGVRHNSAFTVALSGAASKMFSGVFVTVQEPTYDREREAPERTYTMHRRKDNHKLATMKVQTLPGCCGVCLLRNFTGDPSEVAKFIKIGQAAAHKLKYGLVMLTLKSDSPVIDQLGWAGEHFRNGKTGNMVAVITKDLRQEVQNNVVGGE